MDKRFRSSSTEKSVQKSSTIKFDNKELKACVVQIKRKISSSNETKGVDRTLQRPEDIKIRRRRGEGSHPIFDRSDVIVNKEDTEQRTVSTYSPQRSPSRLQNNSHKSSDNYTSFGSDSPRRGQESRRNSRHSRSPLRDNKSSRSNRNSSSPHRNIRSSPQRHIRTSPHRDNRPSTSQRDFSSSSRNRSRSRDSSRRSRRSRSRSRSSRRELGRRRNSPDDRDRRRHDHERRNYDHNERDRRHDRRRSPRYARRRSTSRPPHMTPIDPATVIPMILPPFYGPEDAVWFAPPIRPMMFPPGIPIPPRGMYRSPMPGFRPHLPGRPPYAPPRQQPFRQIRPQNRPQLQ